MLDSALQALTRRPDAPTRRFGVRVWRLAADSQAGRYVALGEMADSVYHGPVGPQWGVALYTIWSAQNALQVSPSLDFKDEQSVVGAR